MLISEIKFQPSNREFNLESETVGEIGGTDTVTPNLIKGLSQTRLQPQRQERNENRSTHIFLSFFSPAQKYLINLF